MPPASATNPYAIDPVKFHAKIASISAHLAGAAADLASCTDTPFDDLAASYLPAIFQALLTKFVSGPANSPSMMSAAPLESMIEDHVTTAFTAEGKIITPQHLAIVVEVIKAIIPFLPMIFA